MIDAPPPVGQFSPTAVSPPGTPSARRSRRSVADFAIGAATAALFALGSLIMAITELPALLLGAGLVAASLVLAWRRSRRLAEALIVVVALPLLGAGYEAQAERQATDAFPPPGQVVNADGASLHLLCQGRGTPTVVLESGLGDPSMVWTDVQSLVAEGTRVCAYDRAGYGWSARGPLPRDATQVTREFHALLAASGEPGPYLLVGHSIGGLFTRVYAAAYPQDVAGLVLVDPQADSLPAQAWELPMHLGLRSLQRVGVLRASAPVLAEPLGLGAYRPYLPRVLGPSAFDTAVDEMRADGDTQAQSRAVTSLGDLPVVVLSATRTGFSEEIDRARKESHERFAAQSTRGQVIEVPTTHYVHRDRPALVAGSIRMLAGQWETEVPGGSTQR